MNHDTTISDAEQLMRITWLEYEIDTCLQYDLPTLTLEEELSLLNSSDHPSHPLTVNVNQ